MEHKPGQQARDDSRRDDEYAAGEQLPLSKLTGAIDDQDGEERIGERRDRAQLPRTRRSIVADRAICDSRRRGRSDTQRPRSDRGVRGVPGRFGVFPELTQRGAEKWLSLIIGFDFLHAHHCHAQRRLSSAVLRNSFTSWRDRPGCIERAELNSVPQPRFRELAMPLNLSCESCAAKENHGTLSTVSRITTTARPKRSWHLLARLDSGNHCPRRRSMGKIYHREHKSTQRGSQRTDEARFHCESVHAIVLTSCSVVSV